MVEIYIKLAELETKKEVRPLFKQEHGFFLFSMLTFFSSNLLSGH
jgi:hypothetical protein